MRGRSRRLTRLLPDAPLVRAAGRVLGAEVEQSENPEEVDHVWIRLDIGGEVAVAVNTLSKKNRLAGYDPRMRVGMVRGPGEDLPARGAAACGRMDYAEIEARENVFFEHYDRAALEILLLDCCARALALEVWGAPHGGSREGIHQVHSRRASCAVPEDVAGADGALKFYFTGATLLLLFKFCGQK